MNFHFGISRDIPCLGARETNFHKSKPHNHLAHKARFRDMETMRTTGGVYPICTETCNESGLCATHHSKGMSPLCHHGSASVLVSVHSLPVKHFAMRNRVVALSEL